MFVPHFAFVEIDQATIPWIIASLALALLGTLFLYRNAIRKHKDKEWEEKHPVRATVTHELATALVVAGVLGLTVEVGILTLQKRFMTEFQEENEVNILQASTTRALAAEVRNQILHSKIVYTRNHITGELNLVNAAEMGKPDLPKAELKLTQVVRIQNVSGSPTLFTMVKKILGAREEDSVRYKSLIAYTLGEDSARTSVIAEWVAEDEVDKTNSDPTETAESNRNSENDEEHKTREAQSEEERKAAKYPELTTEHEKGESTLTLELELDGFQTIELVTTSHARLRVEDEYMWTVKRPCLDMSLSLQVDPRFSTNVDLIHPTARTDDAEPWGKNGSINAVLRACLPSQGIYLDWKLESEKKVGVDE